MYQKIIYLILINFLLICSAFSLPEYATGKASLSGKVTDKSSGEALPGVSIYFPDLKTGTISQADGRYFIDQLPDTKLLVQVSFLGYKMATETIDLTNTKSFNFSLEESVTEISEVVVTGQSGGIENNRTPSPIAIVPHTQMLQNASGNIINALTKVPGVAQITTGSGISKPVIRGMGYNRVVVVNDGIRQEGQQWGDEHGIEIDENTVNRVEILKGPASLAYGSDAMAGVINMISAPTQPEGSVKGNISSNYQTNNGLVNYSVNLAGNKNGLSWEMRYSNKMAHAYQNKYDGYVYNSGFREQAANTTLGINRSWGFSHLHLSMYALKPGIVEGERDSLSGRFLKANTEIADNSDFHSYQPEAPFQKINHYKAVWDNRFFIGQSKVEATIGFQQNRRKEFESPAEYGLFFLLNTLNYDFKYVLPEKNNWKLTAGISGMRQQSENRGTEFLVPEYTLFDFGVYTIASKRIGKLDISGGLRYDTRSEDGRSLYLNENGEVVSASEPNVSERFSNFSRTFSGISGSIGATWQISESVYSKLNVSRGFRAPNIAELGSNGVHEGTQRYEIGNPGLKPETSLQLDYALGLNITHVSAELNVFTNTVDHYIFINKLSWQESDPLFGNLPAFRFSEGNARFYGGEIQIDIHPHPLDWLHLENSFSYVNGTLKNQPDESRYLPFIPAPAWISDVKAEFDKVNRFLANSYISVGIEKTWKQDHIYAAYNTETATPGYMLLHMGLGTDYVPGNKTRFSVYISANNLTNVAYQSHLSRLKYVGYNYATGRAGIFNMGRNISVKLIIPVNFLD